MTPDQWLTAGDFITLQGHRLFYRTGGNPDGTPLLLIHGFPTASWDWHAIWPTLAERYRLVTMDMLGFGFSDKPARHRYSILEQADLIEALVKHLDLPPFHVLAHDYGDTVAQELLARQNQGTGSGRWLSVCFLNGGLFPETHRALPTQRLLLSPIGGLVNRLSSKRLFDRSLSRTFGPDTQPDAETLARMWALVNHNRGKNILYRLITYMNERRQYRERWVGALADAGMPVALINGSADPISGAHMVARYQELELRLDFLMELPTIGHYPQIEAPRALEKAYASFLDGLSEAEETT